MLAAPYAPPTTPRALPAVLKAVVQLNDGAATDVPSDTTSPAEFTTGNALNDSAR